MHGDISSSEIYVPADIGHVSNSYARWLAVTFFFGIIFLIHGSVLVLGVVPKPNGKL
jgi:hypothetical protein